MISELQVILEKYLFDTEEFWPGNDVFSERNRLKILKLHRQLGIRTRSDVQEKIIPILERRASKNIPSLFVLSRGGSGCHFFSDILETNATYGSIGEIYFPPKLIEIVEKADDALKHALLDFVSFLPTARNGILNEETIPVNIMHLTDVSLAHALQSHLKGSRFICLIRNPYEIVYSLTYRKEDYRKRTNPNLSDVEYGASRARIVDRFYTDLEKIRWDAVVRYENIVQRPIEVCKDTLVAADLPSGNLHGIKSKSTNYNKNKRHDMEAAVGEVAFRKLAIHAASWKYEPPSYIRFPDLSLDSYWKPMDKRDIGKNDIDRARADNNVLVARGMDPFDAHTDIAALDMASKTLTWKMYFWSACWIDQLSEFPDGSQLQLQRFLELVDLSRGYCIDSKSAPVGYWDDHATAYRSAVLISMFHKHYDHEDVRRRSEEFSFIFHEHYQVLEGFFESGKWKGNNHSIFHVMAQLNLANSCEFIVQSEVDRGEKRRKLSERLQGCIQDIIDFETGISREQSFHYHFWSVSLLERVSEFSSNLDFDLGFDPDELIKKMLDFGERIILPENACPAIGDTPFSRSYGETFLDKYQRAPILKKPSDGDGDFCIIAAPANEFVVARHDHVDEGNASLLTMTGWHGRHSHGHYDTLSVWFSKKNVPVLIDSGGPFLYGNPLRFEYFIQSVAHNTVIVDRKNYHGGGCIDFAESAVGRVFLRGRIDDNNGARHDRVCIQSHDDGLIVIDKVASLSDENKRFDALFHLAPEFRARRSNSKAHGFAGVSSAALKQENSSEKMHFLCSEAGASLTVTSGDKDPFFKSWVTRSQGDKEENRCLVFGIEAKSCFLVTVLEGDNPCSGVQFEGAENETLVVSMKQGTELRVDLRAAFSSDQSEIKQAVT
ncbi:heparinase II/III domain-containing protein [Falsiruegeria mediterranea]|uniref:heparinase II/III domain-containing protein n=1 Tax=Falsiruegeria mediterranea TaxID=1280832 RepID=UPI0015F28F5D|nr:heparinase II/III family protein [Falsiruegeria mediterranea]